MNCVETKTTMPILCHILIRAEGQTVHVSATDLDLAVSMTLEAQVREPGALAIIGKPLLAQFAGRSGDAELFTTPSDRMRVKVGSSSALLVGLKAENFPNLPSHSGDPVLEINATKFAGMLRRVMFAAGDQYEFVNLCRSNGSMRATALDGQRMSTACEKTESEFAPFLLPSAMVALIIKFAWPSDAIASLYKDSNMLHLVTDSVRITSRQPATGTFPDLDRLLSIAKGGSLSVIPRKDLVASIASASMFSDQGSRRLPKIRLEFSQSSLKLSAGNLEVGDYEAGVPCIGSSDLSVDMNPFFISQFLSSTDEASVAFLLPNDNNHAIEIRPGDGSSEAHRYIAMPMRG